MVLKHCHDQNQLWNGTVSHIPPHLPSAQDIIKLCFISTVNKVINYVHQ